MKLKIGISPCPNDTFIFYALLHNKIDTEGINFEVLMKDVEQLNSLAFRAELPITKLSYHALAYLTDKYDLLNTGSALGNNCGPLLIAKRNIALSEIANCNVLIPGKFTTANFLFNLAFPKVAEKEEVIFSKIEDMILQGKADAGVIIHENRFTYEEKGLVKLIDLGEYWEEKYNLPIPLGGIVIDKQLSTSTKQMVDRVIKRSVEYAFENQNETLEYVRMFAQEMDDAVILKHIGLYVNSFTSDLGLKGKEAVQKLYQVAEEKKIIPPISRLEFVPVTSSRKRS